VPKSSFFLGRLPRPQCRRLGSEEASAMEEAKAFHVSSEQMESIEGEGEIAKLVRKGHRAKLRLLAELQLSV
jgi:hypothetical protein